MRFHAAEALLPLLLLTGCVSTPPVLPSPEKTPNQETTASAKITLTEALRRARTEQLDADTVESLGQIAGEHLHNLTLLRLPGIAEEQRSGSELPPERLLDLLDGAIAYNQLLSAPPGSDLEEERRPRIAQLLAWENTANWTKLAAVREKITLLGGGGTLEQRQEEGNLLLELRIATGLSRDGLALFDYATLAEPRLLACELSGLQRRAVRVRSESALAGFPAELPGKVRALPGMKGAEMPRLAELLYRLPRHLAELQLAEPNRDLRKLAQLGSATGVAFEVDFSLTRLRAAWEQYDLARQKAELNPGSVECGLALIDARRDWRLAYYRLLTDLGADLTVPFEETPEKGEELLPKESALLLTILREAGK